MAKGGKRIDSLHTAYTSDDFQIDKIASLWNQLRLAWISYHQEKKKGNDTKNFEILIINLLYELGIQSDADQMAEIFKLSIDEIPQPIYGGKSNESGKHI